MPLCKTLRALSVLASGALLLLSQGALAATQVILETNLGNITVELYEKEAPISTKNFLTYVNEGFYNGTIFHRVIPDFIVQAGGFTKELAEKPTKSPIKNEAKDSLKNVRGTLSMARLSAPDTATSQFFINIEDNKNLDYQEYNIGYAVFAKVIDGMQVVNQIANSPTGSLGMHRDVPTEAIEIIKTTVLVNVASSTIDDTPDFSKKTSTADVSTATTSEASPVVDSKVQNTASKSKVKKTSLSPYAKK